MRALSDAEIALRLARDLPLWALERGAIERRLKFTDWKAAAMALNAVSFLAERANHHPDLALSYGKLAVRLSTHDANGVSERDFSLAREIDALLG